MASKLRFSCPVRHQTFLKGGITLGAVFKLILGRFRAFQGFKRRSKARWILTFKHFHVKTHKPAWLWASSKSTKRRDMVFNAETVSAFFYLITAKPFRRFVTSFIFPSSGIFTHRPAETVSAGFVWSQFLRIQICNTTQAPRGERKRSHHVGGQFRIIVSYTSK